MGRDLTNLYIDETFQYLLQKSGSDVQDGTGNPVSFLNLNVVSASFAVSASYAVSASHEIVKEVSSSYADFAQVAGTAYVADAALSASYVLGSNVDGTVSSATSSSFATFAATAGTSGTATTASYAVTATSASHAVNADNSISSSYSVSALSSSYSNTSTSASHALAADTSISSSHSLTSISASHAVNADIVGLFNKDIVDGSTDMFLSTDGAGNLSFDWVKTLHQNIHNAEAVSISRGTPLFVSGSTGDNANVYIADAANPARRPATLIAGDATLAPSGTGTGLISGEIQGVDTNAYPAGTIVYLAAGGGWTATRPTGATTLIQTLGIVTRRANNGRGVIFNQVGNNLPNITQGSVWVGNGGAYPTEAATGSLSVAFAVSSSHAIQADSATSATTAISSSHALQADNASTAVSASHAINADNALSANLATTASYVAGNNVHGPVSDAVNAVSASHSEVTDQINVEANSTGLKYIAYLDAATTGTRTLQTEAGLVYTPATNTLTTNTFVGALQGNAQTATSASYATSASHALASDTVNDINVAYVNQNNNFTGTQTFDNINVNGTGSFAYISSVTGSAKIIGDAFIILNNDTPAERYAGIIVQDSGSGAPLTTASLQFDGQNNDWFYEYSDDGGATVDHGVVLFGPEYSTKGTPTYPTTNTIQKGTGGHHLADSIIEDNGTFITVNGNSLFLGGATFATGATGSLLGNASTATSASYAATATSASHALQADSATSSTTAVSSSYASVANALTAGDKTLSGALSQTFAAPGTNQAKSLITLTGAQVNGKAYNQVLFQVGDYPGYGTQFNDYFGIEYYDSAGYNYGSEFDINGSGVRLFTQASGSAFGNEASVTTVDRYDGTADVVIKSTNGEVQLTGGAIVVSGSSTNITGSLGVLGNTKISVGTGLRNFEVTNGSYSLYTNNDQLVWLNNSANGGFVLSDQYGFNWYNAAFTVDFGLAPNLNTLIGSGTSKSGLYSTNGSGYYRIFDIQDATNFTDGRIQFYTPVSASAGVIGNLTGDVTGNASTATSASHALYSDTAGSANSATTAVSASYATFASSAGTATNATSASYAVTSSYSSAANSLTPGNKTLSGALTQTFTAPGTNGEVSLVEVNGAVVNGKAYNRTFFGMADYPSFGTAFNDYFAIEYYDSFGYNFGSEFDINGHQASLVSVPSGSGFGGRSYIQTVDNYDGTSNVNLWSGTNGEITLTAPTITITGGLDTSGKITGTTTTLGTSGTVGVDISTNNFFKVTPSGTITLALSGAPASNGQTVSIVIDNSASQSVSFTGVQWPGGTAPTITAGGVDVVTFISVGGTIYGTAVQNFS